MLASSYGHAAAVQALLADKRVKVNIRDEVSHLAFVEEGCLEYASAIIPGAS